MVHGPPEFESTPFRESEAHTPDAQVTELHRQLMEKESVIKELDTAARERLEIIVSLTGSLNLVPHVGNRHVSVLCPADEAQTGFVNDFTSRNIPLWSKILEKFSGLPNIRGLEIGCHEGRSSLWFLENVLQHESSRLTCVDPRPSPTFAGNLRPYAQKVRFIQAPSFTALRDLAMEDRSMHFVYVDGDHFAPAVLGDAILVFPLLISGGILIFDDYDTTAFPDCPQSNPKLGIDSFVSVYRDHLRVLYNGNQFIVEKL